jgi:putative transposase
MTGRLATVRHWALKFGTIIARKLRRGRPRPDGRWHLDEVFVSINGRQLYVWRAVDSEGEVLDILVQPRRDRKAALKLMRKLLKKQGITPAGIVTDKLRSYGSALHELGVAWRHDTGRCDPMSSGSVAKESKKVPTVQLGLRVSNYRHPLTPCAARRS